MCTHHFDKYEAATLLPLQRCGTLTAQITSNTDLGKKINKRHQFSINSNTHLRKKNSDAIH